MEEVETYAVSALIWFIDQGGEVDAEITELAADAREGRADAALAGAVVAYENDTAKISQVLDAVGSLEPESRGNLLAEIGELGAIATRREPFVQLGPLGGAVVELLLELLMEADRGERQALLGGGNVRLAAMALRRAWPRALPEAGARLLTESLSWDHYLDEHELGPVPDEAARRKLCESGQRGAGILLERHGPISADEVKVLSAKMGNTGRLVVALELRETASVEMLLEQVTLKHDRDSGFAEALLDRHPGLGRSYQLLLLIVSETERIVTWLTSLDPSVDAETRDDIGRLIDSLDPTRLMEIMRVCAERSGEAGPRYFLEHRCRYAPISELRETASDALGQAVRSVSLVGLAEFLEARVVSRLGSRARKIFDGMIDDWNGSFDELIDAAALIDVREARRTAA